MTGPEVLDVSRDAIFTLIVVSSPVILIHEEYQSLILGSANPLY